MTDVNPWFRLILAVLATWRITHLLASEDGPWDLVVRLRMRIGHAFLGRLMDCFYCLSLWISLPFAFFVVERSVDRLCAWLAISGAACLLNRLGHEPVVFRSLEGEPPWDAVAKSEPRS